MTDYALNARVTILVENDPQLIRNHFIHNQTFSKQCKVFE